MLPLCPSSTRCLPQPLCFPKARASRSATPQFFRVQPLASREFLVLAFSGNSLLILTFDELARLIRRRRLAFSINSPVGPSLCKRILSTV